MANKALAMAVFRRDAIVIATPAALSRLTVELPDDSRQRTDKNLSFENGLAPANDFAPTINIEVATNYRIQ